jgi:hypothetical protein
VWVLGWGDVWRWSILWDEIENELGTRLPAHVGAKVSPVMARLKQESGAGWPVDRPGADLEVDCEVTWKSPDRTRQCSLRPPAGPRLTFPAPARTSLHGARTSLGASIWCSLEDHVSLSSAIKKHHSPEFLMATFSQCPQERSTFLGSVHCP